MRQAQKNQSKKAAAKTRHLNLRIGADEALLSLRSWREAGDTALSLDDFEEQDCHLRPDLAAAPIWPRYRWYFHAVPLRPGGATYTAFARCYLNDASPCWRRGTRPTPAGPRTTT